MGAETQSGEECVNQPKCELSLFPQDTQEGGAKKSDQTLYRATEMIEIKGRCPFLCFSVFLPFFLFE